MSKVKCLWKSQFSQKISFLNCFRSEISGKFMPYSIQVHQNHPVASLEAGASDVLSDCDRLFEADHWIWDSEKTPNWRFSEWKIELAVWTKIQMFILLIIPLMKLKHMVGVFVQSLRSVDSLKLPIRAWKHIRDASFWGCLRVFVVNLDAVGHKFAASFWPKTAEKTWFLWKLRFSRAF